MDTSLPLGVEGYEVLYWPMYTSSYEIERADNVNDKTVNLNNLRPYTVYSVAVRLYCSGNKQSMASTPVTFTTEATGELAIYYLCYLCC